MKKKTVCISFCVLFVIVVLPTSGTIAETSLIPTFIDNTLYVGGSGPNNYTKIQDAINDAVDGDTVFVFNNSSPYYENVKVDKSIDLVGENMETTVIDGNSSGNVVKISADWVTISGFTIRNGSGGPGPGSAGILLSNHNTITDNIISSNEIGIFCNPGDSNTITGNTISSNIGYGIWLRGDSNKINIIGNTISSNIGYGICLYGDSNKIKIIGNTISSNKNDGIILEDSGSNTITGNTISSNEGDGIKLFSDGNIITNNSFFTDGIWLHGDNNIIANNSFFTDGIWLGGDFNIITGNSFIIDGLLVWDSCHNKVENNTVNGKCLLYLEKESDKVIDYEVGQVILVNCYNITVKNINISNTNIGIELYRTNYSKIMNNSYSNNRGRNIYLRGSSNNNIISGNNISNNSCGIYLDYILCQIPSNNTIIDNNIFDNGCGIRDSGYGTIITGNTISSNVNDGILLDSDSNTITGNTISSNGGDGIKITFCKNSIIAGNNIILNKEHGIYLISSSSNNIINKNNFINNERNSQDYGDNVWDDGKYGNYWSDYRERYPFARRSLLKPWMWNTPYDIPSMGNKDRCPLVNQWFNSRPRIITRDTPTFNSFLSRFFNIFPILQKILPFIK